MDEKKIILNHAIYTSGNSSKESGYHIVASSEEISPKDENTILSFLSYNGFFPPENVPGYAFFEMDKKRYAFANIMQNGVDAGGRRRYYSHIFFIKKKDFEILDKNPFTLKDVLNKVSFKYKDIIDFFTPLEPIEIDIGIPSAQNYGEIDKRYLDYMLSIIPVIYFTNFALIKKVSISNEIVSNINQSIEFFYREIFSKSKEHRPLFFSTFSTLYYRGLDFVLLHDSETNSNFFEEKYIDQKAQSLKTIMDMYYKAVLYDTMESISHQAVYENKQIHKMNDIYTEIVLLTQIKKIMNNGNNSDVLKYLSTYGYYDSELIGMLKSKRPEEIKKYLNKKIIDLKNQLKKTKKQIKILRIGLHE